jgi:hypothetical protein
MKSSWDINENLYCCGSYLVSLKDRNYYCNNFTNAEFSFFKEATNNLLRHASMDQYKTFFYLTLTVDQIREEQLEWLYELGWILLAASKSAHGNYPIYHLGLVAKPFERKEDAPVK